MNHTRTVQQALLNPRSVALVGASGNLKKNTARPLRFMQEHGYDGNVYPVNPSHSEILGCRAYRTLSEIPEKVDHVFVMIPSEKIGGVLEECAEVGAKLVTIYSDGFAELGEEGLKLQNSLFRKAETLGLRLLGPNSIGTANLVTGAILSVNAAFENKSLNIGDIALVSQSGSMMGSVYSRAEKRGFGFSHLISVGNESDLSVGEIVDALVDDPNTRCILLFLETIRKKEELSVALKRAQLHSKPVVAYCLGRSQQGQQLAQSHTGAIAGSTAGIDAFLKAHGVFRVDFFESLFEMVPLVVKYFNAPRPGIGNHKRVAVLTTTGGGAATVVDQLGLKGVDAVAPPTEFIKKMERQGIKIERQPIIDLTLAATSEQFQYLLEAILSDNWCDAVIAVAGSSAQFHASLAVEPLIRAKKSASKPLVAFLTPEAHKSLELLRENEIAAFRTPESCADSMSSFLNTSSKELLIEQSARPISWPEELPKYGVLVESQALKVWNELGINHPKEKVINCNDLTHDIPYPLVVKVSSPDILHKTEVQGVQVGIENESELESAINKIKLSVSKRLPNARIQGFQLQQMEQNLIELIVGYRDDPTVGPIVLLGAGGITAELSEDVSIRLAPVSREQAKQMIDEVKLTKLIRGYRNLPEGNIDAIMDTITAISRLAELKDVKVLDAEINPLFVQTDRVVAVDGLIVLKDSQE